MALMLAVTGCGNGISAAGTDCAAIGRPPLTEQDIAGVSDETVLWLRAATEYCGW